LQTIVSISDLAFSIPDLKAGKKSSVFISENGAVLYSVLNNLLSSVIV
jgi:hypothetical protein